MSNLEDIAGAQSQGGKKDLIEKVNILDSRLVVQDTLMFGVEKSGQQVTQHVQPASSFTTSGCQFSVVVPSITTVISRKVILRARVSFTITATHAAAGTNTVLPNSLCLAPFAFHQMCSNITCTINNNSFSFDCYNQLNEVLRCLDKDVLKESNSYTPTQLDSYARYQDVAGNTDGAGTANANYPFVLDSPFRGAGGASATQDCPTRGTYLVSIAGNAASAAGALTTTAVVTVDIVEPLLMSPFLLSTIKSANCGGFYGIQNLDFNFQFRSGGLRALRGVFEGFAASTCSIAMNPPGSNGQAMLEFTYLTPQPSLSLPSRNIVPYLQLQTFKSNVPDMSAAFPGNSYNIVSNTVQLNSLPDSVIFGVRKLNRQAWDADAYLPLNFNTNGGASNGLVSINFANQPGIMSNASGEELYEMTKNAGLNMSWNEWSGVSQICMDTATVADAAAAAGAAAAAASALAGGNVAAQAAASTAAIAAYKTGAGIVQIPTCGSLCKLDFGRHINIPQDYYAPGSVAQFSFQMNINVLNNTGVAINAGNPYELICIFVHSGMIVNSMGTTVSYIGLLLKEDVLESATKPVINKGLYERLYGAGWWSSIKSGITKSAKYAKPLASFAKQGLAASNDPRAQAAAKALGMAGAGMSAGGKFSGRTY